LIENNSERQQIYVPRLFDCSDVEDIMRMRIRGIFLYKGQCKEYF